MGQEDLATSVAQPQCRVRSRTLHIIKMGRKDSELKDKSFSELRKSQEFLEDIDFWITLISKEIRQRSGNKKIRGLYLSKSQRSTCVRITQVVY